MTSGDPKMSVPAGRIEIGGPPAARKVLSCSEFLASVVGDDAGVWDRQGYLPDDVVRDVAKRGLLCAQVGPEFGGLGLTSVANGALTVRAGELCGSLRSLMTSQGMAAWTLQRLASASQRQAFLPGLASGTLAGVAFSEHAAGSDLSAIQTTIRTDGDKVVVDGAKVWVTGAAYADFLLVFGGFGPGAGVVVVPTDAPGVEVTRVPDPLGCRAAGHADVRLDAVRLPADHLLTASGAPLAMLATTALTYGRLSVAWGCVGILRTCLAESVRHAGTRVQFGRPLAEHQLVARHLAELTTAERVATLTAEHASRCWDASEPDLVTAAVLAKQVAATGAARGAATAVQLLASAGAHDGHPVARAYRDAKLMEIIEGSTEICQLLLAEHAMATTR